MTKRTLPRPYWKIPVLLICLFLAATLTWYNIQGYVSHPGLLTAVLLVLLYGLVATGVIPTPSGVDIPFFTVWPRLSDVAKAATSFALIFLWTPTSKALVPESVIGAVVVLAPDAVFLVAALIYLSNGLARGRG